MNKYLINLSLSLLLLAGCQETDTSVHFSYSDVDFTPTIGILTNDEEYDYANIVVNPIDNLRADFAMGVDASMVDKIEELGGVYYNENGQEQDLYQIMAINGVNFFRIRIWNNPMNILGDGYGGGDVDTRRAIHMAKRAAAVGMNIMVDYHYSDFWADPEKQRAPSRWMSKTLEEIPAEVEDFTKNSLLQFKNAGVDVAALQIGNEINNGMIYPFGQIDWSNSQTGFDAVASFLKGGIAGAKAVFPNIYSVIHLANGGAKEEFDYFFTQMENRDVPYDIVGVSYYPYYHGSLTALKNNVDNIANKFNKPVIIAEISYGYTTAPHNDATNIYNQNMEEAGKYLTSIQGQATAIRDVSQIMADIPNNLGLGIFYWEPAWLPIEGAGWATAEGQAWADYGDGVSSTYVSKYTDGKSTWANQGLFSYTGKMLPSLQTFKLMRGTQTSVAETTTAVHQSTINVTINLAENEQLPETYSVETNLGAIRQAPVAWNTVDLAQLDEVGHYTVRGTVDGTFMVTAEVEVISNFVQDPGYENQGSTDALLAPWTIETSTPTGQKIVKLNRKPQDVRTGTSDLNWYYTEDFTFEVTQTIENITTGTYRLTTYIMAVSPEEIAHQYLDVFIEINGEKTLLAMKDQVLGWGTVQNYYVPAIIDDINLQAGDSVKIGIQGQASAKAWGHVDDWSLVKVS